MKIMLIIIVFLLIGLFYSLRFCLRIFDKFEVFLLFLLCSFLCQHLNYKVFSAYDRLSVQKEVLPKILSYLHFGLISPALLIWVLYWIRSGLPFSVKLLITFIWICIDLLSKRFYLSIHVLKSSAISWYPIVDVLISMMILFLAVLFMEKARTILKREKVID